jgi:hypothetical protein
VELAEMAETRTPVCGLSAVVVLAVLAITGTKALAETADNKPPAAVPDRAYIGNESLETCMQRWDADTHMTKDAWRKTCERIKKEREPYAKDR